MTDDHTMRHVSVFLLVLMSYHEYGEDILDQVMTGDETWVHYYTPPTNQANKNKVKTGEYPRVKVKTERSVNKCMVTIFWDRKGVILTHSMPRGITINADTYCLVLQDLRMTVCCKRPGQQCKFILLLHDSARAHSAIKMKNLLQQFGWTVFEHPIHSPNFLLSSSKKYPKH